MKTVICTTGTSIARGVPRLGAEDSLDAYARLVRERVRDEREKSGEAFLAQVSAETHALRELSDVDEIILLHTDTRDGELCANELAKVIEAEMGLTPSLERIEGLQVTDAARFRRTGVQNLFATLSRLREARPPATHEVILNATGGYKGVVAYLTLYGLLYRLRVIYLFEFGDELLNLPPAPLSFDFEGLGRAQEALAMLRRDGAVEKQAFFEAIEGLEYDERDRFESLLEEEDGLVTLSCFGQLLEDARESGRAEVLLHERCASAYEGTDASVRPVFARLFSKVADPLWRSSHIHAFRGTDLLVWKVPRSSVRAAGYELAGKVHICLAFATDHDAYEKQVAAATRADFADGPFVPWTPPPDLDLDVPIEEDLLARTAQAEARATAAEDAQLEALEQVQKTQAGLDASRQETAGLREQLDGVENELRARETELRAREDELRALRHRQAPEIGLRDALRHAVRRRLERIRGCLPF